MTSDVQPCIWPEPVAPTPLQSRRMRRTWIAAGLVAAGFVFAQPSWLNEEVSEWIGYPFLIAAVLGRVVCSMYVGGRKNAVLVTKGPYSIVRNPLYLFSLLGVVGIGLVTGMLAVLVLMVMAFLLYYSEVVRREERYLAEKFGDEYRRYERQVPRWLPRPWLWQSPEVIEIRPRDVLVTLRDIVWLPLLFPVIELLEYLHAVGVLPVLYRVP